MVKIVDIVEQSFQITELPEFQAETIECVGRDAYDSHDRKKAGGAPAFCRMLINQKPKPHTSVLEFSSLTVRIKTSRDVSHELVRSRLASYLQSSQRFINYLKGIEFVNPAWADHIPAGYDIWKEQMREVEAQYAYMVGGLGMKPEQARTILPNSTATIINMRHNIRGWRETLELRTGPGVYPEMRNLMATILAVFTYLRPEFFDDLFDGLDEKTRNATIGKVAKLKAEQGDTFHLSAIECIRP